LCSTRAGAFLRRFAPPAIAASALRTHSNALPSRSGGRLRETFFMAFSATAYFFPAQFHELQLYYVRLFLPFNGLARIYLRTEHFAPYASVFNGIFLVRIILLTIRILLFEKTHREFAFSSFEMQLQDKQQVHRRDRQRAAPLYSPVPRRIYVLLRTTSA
jgi:hypothetical protein